MRLPPPERPRPRQPENRGIGAAAWGGLVVLATVFGVLQGPKALADLHELTCGWPAWQGIAGAFGDCASYAAKPTTTVVVTTSTLPKGPVPRAVIYQEQLKQFHIAFRDNDEVFLKHLYDAGFRIDAGVVCSALPRREADPGSAMKAVKTLLTFSKGEVDCDAGKGIGGDVLILRDVMSSHFRGCWGEDSTKYWSGTVAAIDQWIAIKGRSGALVESARANLNLIERAKAASRDDYIRACVIFHGEPRLWGQKIADQEKGTAEQLLHGTGTCPVVDWLAGGSSQYGSTLPNEIRRRLQSRKFIGISQEKEQVAARETAQEVCGLAIKKTGMTLPPKQIEQDLRRWAKQ